MVPQLLPPVAATTIGTPTQKAPSDRNPAAAACRTATVFTFYFVLLALCLPLSHQGLETHSQWSKIHVTCRIHACTPHVCTCTVYTSGEQRENQMSTSELELPGGGGQARLPARAAKQTMRFSQNTRAGGPWGVAI